MKIKTRFAPSPTGYLHVGGARTALYSRLFSRHAGGEFVLRIEDTDLGTLYPDAIDAIMDGMNWLNLDWDEGPYFQTKRFDRYNAVIDEMLEQGTAYKCYCSKEPEALREADGKRREAALRRPLPRQPVQPHRRRAARGALPQPAGRVGDFRRQNSRPDRIQQP